MKHTLITLTAMLLAITSPLAHSQNQAAFDPFSRTGLVTQDQLVSANAAQQNQQNQLPTAVKPNLNSPAQTEAQSKQNSVLSQEQQKIFEKYNTKNSPVQMAAQPSQSTQILANKAIIAPASPAKPRYIQNPPSNVESLDFFTKKGTDKANHYGNNYLSPAPTLPTAVSNTKQMELLDPTIAALRNQGHDESKITLELNRLTPAQFVQWAKQIRQ